MHPSAEALRYNAGITEAHAEEILGAAALRNPALLIGGFNVDYVILAMWLELHTYDELSEDDINNRIDRCLAVLYEGLI